MREVFDPRRWDIYVQAVTHASYVAEHGGQDNERLEFIGDAVLQMCVSEVLFREFPDANEGQLSRMRRQVVNNTFLAHQARMRQLGSVLRLGSGEAVNGGARREKILAGTFEAILGAIYLDQGLRAAMMVVTSMMKDHLARLPSLRNPKLVLQEWCQKQYRELPSFHLVGTVGPDHNRRYRMAVDINGERLAEGQASSKRKAATQAAVAALQVLRKRGVDL